ncbi:hypothetical protein FE782_03265 [Paenibacillus antri]|uniref:Uncharacterized protein n=1 Tax=Paenibacillus antri TaxID=2582848 RepID=A0A5R9GDW6_9BACL|nr:hypothetical protein [Paenibacillus antri]TLS53309.1 hypothetical protein FE782_03265 [Paenibacillus antri]
MKRTGSIRWIVAGAVLLLLSLIAWKLLHTAWNAASFGAGSAHGHGVRGGGFGHAGPAGFRRGAGPLAEGNAPPWAGWGMFAALLKLGVTAAAIALWAKTTGFLRWAGACLAVLGAISLLSPWWAAALTIAVFWFATRKSDEPAAVTASPVSSVVPDVAIDRGTLLDEWERKQHKEEH